MQTIHRIDKKVLQFIHQISVPFAKFALFIIFFWFGILKVIGLSPAGQMVHDLFNQTISFMPFDLFYLLFGLFECIIGILFLFPGASRFALILLSLHLITTFMPLILLPSATWSQPLVPTLEGQYIIKNLVIIATAMVVVRSLTPLHLSSQKQN